MASFSEWERVGAPLGSSCGAERGLLLCWGTEIWVVRMAQWPSSTNRLASLLPSTATWGSTLIQWIFQFG